MVGAHAQIINHSHFDFCGWPMAAVDFFFRTVCCSSRSSSSIKDIVCVWGILYVVDLEMRAPNKNIPCLENQKDLYRFFYIRDRKF